MKKTIIILLFLSILFCAISCSNLNADGNDTNNSKDSENTTAQNETVAKLSYDAVIEKYTELLISKKNNESIAAPNPSADDIEFALYDIVYDCTDPSVMGYATKDINGDGDDELVLLNKSNKIYAIFTLKDNVPELLLKTDHMSTAIYSDGTIYASRKYIKEDGEYTYIKKIVGGKLEGLEYGVRVEGESASCYKIENGIEKEITVHERDQIAGSIQHIMFNPMVSTKKTGFRFVPAIADDTTPNNAPIADFSSYEGVLSAYKIIVESFSEYSQSDWVNGKFDALFKISDNETYDIFHKLFYYGIEGRPTETYFGQDYAKDGDNAYGYAKKDLNRDGVEELILLNDNYEIFAIFTKSDGKAVFLDGVCGVWVDENGHLYKEISTGGVVSRDGEAFVFEIDGTALKTLVGVGYRVNVFLQKEGWYKTEGNSKTDISKEEGEALYAEYDILPSGYSDGEYTRTFSGIEFVPLFEYAAASQKHINTYSNLIFVNGNAITVSSASYNEVSFSIKFFHTVGKFDSETNPEPEVYTVTITGNALRDGNRYSFEIDGVKGYIELSVNSLWVTVTQSENEHVMLKSYLFDYPEN